MASTVFQGSNELNFGERDGQASVVFLRTGDLSGAVEVTYDVTADSASPGADYLGFSGVVRFEPGQDRASVTFDILDDAAGEPTETFVVSLVSADGGLISVPRTCRVNILDDETPVLPPANPPLVSDYRVNTQPVISGLSMPTNVEFAPADLGLAYVAEKAGLIRVFDMATGADKGAFIDLRGQVNDYVDRGLLDVVVHPDFKNQPYLYASYVVDPPDAAANGMLDAAGNRFLHVVRFTADAASGFTRVVPGSGVVIAGGAGTSLQDINGGGTLEFEKPTYASYPSSERYVNPDDPTPPVVIDGLKQNYIKVDAQTHAGGALAFGPDGMLYISTGDGTSPNYADPHATDVQNLNSLSGKILRVDPMTGRGLADNPFHQDGQSLDANISKVFQFGLRNPFSMAFDRLGQLFITDTGWSTYEEVNTGEAGANFGWPWYEGREGGRLNQTGGYSSLPGAAAFYQGVADGTIVVKPPYAAFSHSASTAGFQNNAITGSSFILSGDRYPADLNDNYLFSDFTTGHVFSVDTLDRLDVEYLYKAAGPHGPVHFAQGPDGYVYYVDLGDFATGSSNGGIGRLLLFPKDGPLVTVAATPASMAEEAGRATLTFSLSAAQSAPVTVTYSTVNGTAVAGADFEGRTNATAVVAAGQTSVTVAVPLTDDAVQEGSESFSVSLFGATLGGAPIATGGPATVTVVDGDQPPTAPNLLVNGSFESSAVGAGKFAAFASVPGWTALAGGRIELWNGVGGVTATNGVNLAELDYRNALDGFYQDVTTTAGQAYALAFDLRQRSGVAATTQDVEVLWNGALVAVAKPGAQWGTATVAVTGTGGTDRLTVREVGSQGADGLGALLDNFRLTATGAPPATVSVAANPSSVSEGAGSTTLTFSLSAAQSGPVTVTYSTVSGTALAGSDFVGQDRATAVISAGQTKVSVPLSILNDAAVEPTESFSVALNGATLGGVAVATGDPATVSVLDNDAPSSNLLVNGSFEASTVAAGRFAAFTTVPGWTALAGGRIELWNAHRGVTATEGTDFAELDYAGALDGFYQDVATTAGQTYALAFDLRQRSGVAATTQDVEVVWNGAVVAVAKPGVQWGTATVAVTGTGGTDRLTVREVGSQGADGLGALLDNFRLTASGAPAQPRADRTAHAQGSGPDAAAVAGWDDFVFAAHPKEEASTRMPDLGEASSRVGELADVTWAQEVVDHGTRALARWHEDTTLGAEPHLAVLTWMHAEDVLT